MRQTQFPTQSPVAFVARLHGLAAAALLLAACSSARLVSAEAVNDSASRPAHVYVADFELDPDAIQSQSLLAQLPLRARREQAKARSLVTELTDALVDDLRGKGITAQRLGAGDPRPTRGWLVHGAFTTVDEGNRVARAVVGFGVGSTNLEVSASIEELSAGTAPNALYRLQTDARSGKMPGAVVTLNPYVAAAKFVLDGRDLDRSTRETAAKIADQIAAQVRTAAP
jgi:hypothetical protein